MVSDGSVQQRQSQPAVPLLEEQRVGEILAAVPERRHWRYRPRRVGMVWRSRTFRVVAVFTVLAICGLAILALVRDQTGTQGFLVGLGLAVLPVPLLLAAFRWLDRGDPGPWRNVLFAFAWGAFAAALVAILANSFATRWIATTIADPSNADTLGATVIAPVVEESAKAAAVLLIFLFRRREFNGIVDGVVIAGVTASGFAFTENILYLGNAFGEDQQIGNSGVVSVTAATFFVRAVMSPFAHPLFTVLTGIGFGLAAACARRRRIRRTVLPLLGLVLAMGMHSLWNGSGVLSPYGFYAVYAVFMVPVFGLVTWLVIWSRRMGAAHPRSRAARLCGGGLAEPGGTARPLLDAGPRPGPRRCPPSVRRSGPGEPVHPVRARLGARIRSGSDAGNDAGLHTRLHARSHDRGRARSLCPGCPNCPGGAGEGRGAGRGGPREGGRPRRRRVRIVRDLTGRAAPPGPPRYDRPGLRRTRAGAAAPPLAAQGGGRPRPDVRGAGDGTPAPPPPAAAPVRPAVHSAHAVRRIPQRPRSSTGAGPTPGPGPGPGYNPYLGQQPPR